MILKTFELNKIKDSTIFYLLYGKNEGLKAECINEILKKDNGKIFAIGGRVLNFISMSDNFYKARENIYKNLEKLNWDKGFYRKDIGYKVIEK